MQALRTSGQTIADVFTYTMSDAGGLTSSTQITITIQGANDTPSDITGSLSIAENAANGAVVGTVATTDSDSGDTFTYALTNDAAGRFAINSSTGQITVANGTLLNYEAATSHAVVVQTTDATGASFAKTMTVTVNSVNEAPTSIVAGAASNLLTNGSFENGLTNWTATGTTSLSTTGRGTEGVNSVGFNIGNTINGGNSPSLSPPTWARLT